MTGQPLLRPKLTHKAGFVNSCLNKTTVRSVNSDTLYWLQANQYVVLTPICCMINGKSSNTIRNDEHADDNYTSEEVMTSMPQNAKLLRRSWRALSWALHLAGFVKRCLIKNSSQFQLGHIILPPSQSTFCTPKCCMINRKTSNTNTEQRARHWPLHHWGGHDEHTTNHYTCEVEMTSTLLSLTPPRWSWRARYWPLHL